MNQHTLDLAVSLRSQRASVGPGRLLAIARVEGDAVLVLQCNRARWRHARSRPARRRRAARDCAQEAQARRA